TGSSGSRCISADSLQRDLTRPEPTKTHLKFDVPNIPFRPAQTADYNPTYVELRQADLRPVFSLLILVNS
ncbi:MAG TPA: hypothetical protein VJ756_00165, partial [Terriglobales bacterium]|nr:hypothetical protein [Terriglobales bacterium]